MRRFIKIAECDGGIEVVPKELYERIYAEVADILKEKGPAFVRTFKEQARQAASGVRATLLLTVIEELPDGTVRLRDADEVDYYRKSCAA